MFGGEDWLISRLMFLIPLWLSLSVHEWAHAWTAWKLGDDTARLQGRLTLNPLAHIDPIGTLLLPLMGVPFGWAKPVPVNPLRFRHDVNMRTGMMITAVAGPISNIVIALVSIVVLAVLIRFRADAVAGGAPLGSLLQILIYMNVILAAFNALPIPPLDGSRVVDGLVSSRFRPTWEGFCRMGPIALVAVIALPLVLGISLFGWAIDAAGSMVELTVRLLGG